MKVRFPLMYVGALFAILAIAACASKSEAPVDTAGADTGMTEDAGMDTSDTGDMGDTMGSGDAMSLPTVHFDFDQAVVRPGDRELLKSAADMLQRDTGTSVTIEGHCDDRGSIEYNLALGERRSNAVKSYLVRLGVTSDRLNTISYGEERPANPGSFESAWAENRRGELVSNQ